MKRVCDVYSKKMEGWKIYFFLNKKYVTSKISYDINYPIENCCNDKFFFIEDLLHCYNYELKFNSFTMERV